MYLLLLILHIVGGSIALLAGAAALSVRKGGGMHRKIGTLFFGAMLLMAGTGALIAAFEPERGTAVIGLITCYLVTTSWITARNRSGTAGRPEWFGLAFALACGTTMLVFALQAAASPNGLLDSLPAGAHYPFVVLMALAAALDLNFILRRQLSGVQWVARHLWRMCAALLIAAMSFFLGQQDEFPEAWRGLFIWFVPPLATFAAMIFWIVRVRFSKAYRSWPPRITKAEPAPDAV